MSGLPGATMQNPTCGACHDELSHNGDCFECEGCKLYYDSNDPEQPATFQDEDDEPCGHVSDKPVEEKESRGRWWRFTTHPCPLPTGHKPTGPWDNGHHYPLTADEIPAPERTS